MHANWHTVVLDCPIRINSQIRPLCHLALAQTCPLTLTCPCLHLYHAPMCTPAPISAVSSFLHSSRSSPLPSSPCRTLSACPVIPARPRPHPHSTFLEFSSPFQPECVAVTTRHAQSRALCSHCCTPSGLTPVPAALPGPFR